MILGLKKKRLNDKIDLDHWMDLEKKIIRTTSSTIFFLNQSLALKYFLI